MAKVLIIPGSARQDSVNLKLARAATSMATAAGAEVECIDPARYDLPLYNGDLEDAEGLPELAKKLKAKFIEADAIIFCSPEYNSSITPMLKNLIDWVSRPETEGETPLVAYRGKVAGLLSASPGGLGGMRGLVHLRAILGNIGVHVVPKQFAMSGAYDRFDADGNLTAGDDAGQVEAVVAQVIETADKLK